MTADGEPKLVGSIEPYGKLLAASLSVPPRWLAAEGPTATSTPDPPRAIASGRWPSRTFLSMRFVLGLTRHSVPSCSLPTQIPSRATTRLFGPAPTRIVAITEFERGSMRITVESSAFAADTEPAPKAIADAPFPRLTANEGSVETGCRQ